MIDAEGRIARRACRSARAGVIDARLPPAAPPTLFARFGNLLPFAFALLLVAARDCSAAQNALAGART